MEEFYTSLLLSSSVFIIFFTLMIRKWNQHRKKDSKTMPGPWNLPIIGSLHRLVGSKLPHHILRDLSVVYGPIMSLKLGDIRLAIISSPEAAREIMKTHDIAFASRPINESIKAFTYGGNNIIYGRYGEFWRQMRRLCNVELLSSNRVRSFRAIREDEVRNRIRSIEASSGVGINLSSMMAETNNNIMARTVVGGRCEDQKLFFFELREIVQLISGFDIVDLFPSMPFLGWLTGIWRRIKRCQKNLDFIAENIVREHKEKRDKVIITNNYEKQLMEGDLTDVLLKIQQEDSLPFPLTNDNIKAVINDMLFAGSETTATTLDWAMSEMVRNSDTMKKAQKEVREVFGSSGKLENIIDEELINGRLTYLQLVIKETLRLHPPAPLLLPRENQESIDIMGYEIPAKTKVLVNMWAIGRDNKYWDDADIFRPERFEGSLIDFKGAHFEFIPFGSGRRICPGMQFSLASLEVILAYLIYYFDWEFLESKGNKLDMTEAYGMSTRRNSPLCLVPTLQVPILSP